MAFKMRGISAFKKDTNKVDSAKNKKLKKKHDQQEIDLTLRTEKSKLTAEQKKIRSFLASKS